MCVNEPLSTSSVTVAFRVRIPTNVPALRLWCTLRRRANKQRTYSDSANMPAFCSACGCTGTDGLDNEDIAAGPVHAAVPGLHRESGKPAETLPELRCEPGHVAHKSVQVRLLTCHKASHADEKKILSTSGTQTEPQAVSSGSLDFVSLEQSSALASVQDRLHSCRKKEGPFSCVRCNASFVMKRQLVKHMLIHTGQGPFPCVHCNASFSQKDHLVSHMCVHTGERPFSCVHCNASFSMKGNLVIHMRTHTGERPFSCVHCNASFVMKCQLVKHMVIHPGERPFSCIHCNASFSQKHRLVSHMRMHTGERPFSCGYCSSSFAAKRNLVRHLRTHTGERPFSCVHCSAAFGSKSHLVEHFRMHTRERHFSCFHCNASFSQKRHLTNHMSLRHANTMSEM
uniref:Putative c2h2-type zn-finger protein n=1 Tax=Rhipicephalus microplus TaxID=6941 RepID=A0A6M2D1A0_RHIMP